MHVEQAHEDAHHHSTVVEILVLHRLLHHNHTAVRRSHHNTLRLTLKGSDGALEEVQQNSIENSTHYKANVKRQARLETMQYSKVQCQ